MQLSNKTALITGATTGIGYATAQQFLREGVSTLIITGQDEGRLAEAARTLSDAGTGKVIPVRWRAEEASDVTDVARVVAEIGRLDVLFANAGVTWPAPLGHIDATEAQKQFMVNVTAPLMLVQALSDHMGEGGSIVLTTSCLDVLGMPGMAVYSASKAALRSLARTLQVELKDRHIRVNSVAPGPVETPIYAKLGMSDDDLSAMSERMKGIVPAGRFAAPEEIGGAVTFLASDASRYVLGEEINVDGGWANL